MQFNSYIWNLYKTSANGKQMIQNFESSAPEWMDEQFDLYKNDFLFEDEEDITHWGFKEISFYVPDEIFTYASLHEVNNSQDALDLYSEIIDTGFPVITKNAAGEDETFGNIGGDGLLDYFVHQIQHMSVGLFRAHREYFCPFLLKNYFYQFQNICDEFSIAIGPIPKKKDWRARAMYYMEINIALQEFRKIHDLSPAELCAFLYDFAPSSISDEEAELPKPTKAWLLLGGPEDYKWLEEADETSTSHWQGGIDTRRGDIMMLYARTPHKCIHSIWRAQTDGFVDPFFHYHSTVWVQDRIKTAPVTFAEMKADPVISQMGIIKAHLQGPSGKPFNVEEYEAVLKIMENKGQDISELPRIESTTFLPDIELKNERDVEVLLVEPLLKEIGYSETDWLRQMCVRMGRGEHYYPDYVFNPQTKKGDEHADMVLEAKYRINTRKALTDAYRQAKSYALLLKCKKIVLASVEGIWIFDKTPDFDFDRFGHWNWKQLENPDVLHGVRQMIGV